MRVLIAEDDDPKLHRLREFVEAEFAPAHVTSSRSVNSTLARLRIETPDLIILDMSLPTYEIAIGEQGGRPQDFGGITVMEFMTFEQLSAPVVIVTQYETFPGSNGANLSLEEIAASVAREHPDIFRELIYYNSVENVWQEPLKAAIAAIMEAKADQ